MPDAQGQIQLYVDDMVAARGYVLRYHQILAASVVYWHEVVGGPIIEPTRGTAAREDLRASPP